MIESKIESSFEFYYEALKYCELSIKKNLTNDTFVEFQSVSSGRVYKSYFGEKGLVDLLHLKLNENNIIINYGQRATPKEKYWY